MPEDGSGWLKINRTETRWAGTLSARKTTDSPRSEFVYCPSRLPRLAFTLTKHR